MKKNTTVQEILEHLEDIQDSGGGFTGELNKTIVKSTIIAIQGFIKNEYLPMEEKQIIDAHCAGQDIVDTAGHSDGKSYFDETFNKN